MTIIKRFKKTLCISMYFNFEMVSRPVKFPSLTFVVRVKLDLAAIVYDFSSLPKLL